MLSYNSGVPTMPHIEQKIPPRPVEVKRELAEQLTGL